MSGNVRGYGERGQDFNLSPFDSEGAPPVKLTGRIVRQNRLLEVEFRLRDPSAAIVIPECAIPVERRHNLWKETCFELFFSAANRGSYREINLSPSGHWNHYRFAAYRQGLQEEPSDCLKYGLRSAADVLIVRMQIDLGRLGPKDKELFVRPCSVLLSKEQILSYWALSHPGARPDFHDRQTDYLSV